jgi:hypothetical protein
MWYSAPDTNEAAQAAMPMRLVTFELPGHSDCPTMTLSRRIARARWPARSRRRSTAHACVPASPYLSAVPIPVAAEPWAKTTQEPGIMAQ